MKDMKRFGSVVRLRREAILMSQQELADRLGYTHRSAIAKIEAGANGIPVRKIEAFASALYCPPWELIGCAHADWQAFQRVLDRL